MKLTVTTASASSAGAWQRFAMLAIDHALAAGEEVAAGGVRAVRGDDVVSRAVAGLAVLTGGEHSIVDALAEFDSASAAWPVCLVVGDASDLARLGFRRREWTLLKLKNARTDAAESAGTVVLPGRAARAAVEEWAQERALDDPPAVLLPRHLDDPQYEAFVALQNGRALAVAGLQTRGQTGLVCDLFVRPSDRLRGLASLLLSRAIEAAARGQLAEVYAAVPVDDPAAGPAMRRAGFDRVLSFNEWRPPAGR